MQSVMPSISAGEIAARNDSSNLSYVAARIAEIKGVSVQEVEQTTWENACRVFGVR